jgi:hypothetical protein
MCDIRGDKMGCDLLDYKNQNKIVNLILIKIDELTRILY